MGIVKCTSLAFAGLEAIYLPATILETDGEKAAHKKWASEQKKKKKSGRQGCRNGSHIMPSRLFWHPWNIQ